MGRIIIFLFIFIKTYLISVSFFYRVAHGHFERIMTGNHRNRVVISGMGVMAANGIGLDAFWNSLLEGRSGIGPITLFDASDLPCRIAGEVKHFDPQVYLDPALKPRRMGRFTQLALVAAREAIADARLPEAMLTGTPGVPVVMGISTSAMDVRGRPSTLYSALTGIPNAAGSAIVYAHKIQARLLTISDGCASSLDAVAVAAQTIRNGEADFALAGGADSTIDHYVFECLCKARKLATLNDAPEQACRPFDQDRTGGVVAEGAGILVLENYESAMARGVTPYAELVGYGSHADLPGTAEGSGIEQAIRAVLDNAAVRPEDIGWINAHGPGDPDMDRQEAQVIHKVFGRHAVAVSSIKGATGNAMGVGGVQQVAASAMAIRNRLIAPTTNLERPDSDFKIDLVFGRARLASWRYTLVNTHGFGRGNSCLLLKSLAQP